MYLKIEIMPFVREDGGKEHGDSICINMDHVLYIAKGYLSLHLYFQYIDSICLDLSENEVVDELFDMICSFMWGTVTGKFVMHDKNGAVATKLSLWERA